MSHFFTRWLLLVFLSISPAPKLNPIFLSHSSYLSGSLLSFHSASHEQNEQSTSLSWMMLTLGGMTLSLGGLVFVAIKRSQQHQQQLAKLKKQHCQDLTQAKVDLEKEYMERIQRLEAARFTQNQVIDYISYELHTPLHLIQGYLQLLQRNPNLSLQEKSDLTVIAQNSSYLTNLLDEIREVREIETQEVTLDITCFKPQDLLSDILMTLQGKSQEKGIQLQSYLAPEVPQYIKADQQKLRQIWLNLLEHCLSYTNQGVVTIRLAGSDRCWNLDEDSGFLQQNRSYDLLFEVEDSGKGWEAGDLSHLFEPFFVEYRLNSEGQINKGLGLFLAQKLVRLMQGYLQVSSQLNQGTLFQGKVMVELADAEEIPLSLSHQTVIGLAPNQPNYRILVVDDKVENRQLLLRLLTPLGFHIQEADNGQNALKIWSTWKPHLIFMDTKMPTMDGYETINQMKDYSQYYSTIIIAISSGAIEAQKFNSLLQNCDDILRRPFETNTLLEKISHHLNIKYLYEIIEEQSTYSTQENKDYSSLQFTDLQDLSPSWKQEAYHAASAGHQRKLEELIQQIPSAKGQLISELKNLVYYYNYRKLRELTKPNSNSHD